MPTVERRLQVGEVEISVPDYSAALALLRSSVVDGSAEVFGFANAHTVNLARRSPAFAAALRAMTLFNDGIGVELASRMLTGERLPANLNGTDLTPALLAALPAGTRVYLLGSPPGVAEDARAVFVTRYPTLDFVGAEHGYFGEQDDAAVAARVAATRAQLVIVGMGQPRQELWATQQVATLGAVVLCAGAILDFTAGRFQRAPDWVQSARLEWAYRLALEPKRLAQRYLIGNASFMLHVVLQKYRR